MKHLLIFAFFLCALPALASDIYFAQVPSGGHTGADCANAIGLSGVTWTAGNTYHVCGTVTSQIAPSASGSSGNVITIVFESGANLTANSWPSTGAINLSGKSFIVVDGGTSCGWVNGVLVACNGTIQNTLSGTTGAACTGGPCSIHTNTNGITANGSHDIEVRNLNILNMYVHTPYETSGGDTASACGCQAFVGSGNNLLVHNNITHDDAWALVLATNGTTSGQSIYNNVAYNTDHCFVFAVSGASQILSASTIHDNECYNTYVWDTGSDNAWHHDGIHVYAVTSGTASGLQFYNNYFWGDWGGNPTSHVFIEGAVSTSLAFNNLSIACQTGQGGGGGGACIQNYINDGFLTFYGDAGTPTSNAGYNNTLIGATNANGACSYNQNQTSFLWKNNVLSTCGGLAIDSTSTLTASGVNDNVYYNFPATDGWKLNGTFYNTLAAWRTATGQEASSTTANPLLTASGHPQTGSSAIGLGANLTSLGITPLDSDKAGIARPAVGVWDAGAYSFQASPSPIVSTLFDAGFNQASSPWCPKDGNNVAAQVYGYRIWDDGQKWGQIQTSNTTPNFTGLDNAINTRAGGNNTQAGENIPIGSPCPGTPMAFIYVFGDTPQWASAGAIAANNCASPNTQYSCTKPASLNNDGTGTDVEYATVAADIINRYKNYAGIRYYEIWNEADSNNFWCWNDNTACGGSGSANSPILHANVPSLKNLVRMAWDLKNIAACLDPSAKILSPSFHVGTALTWFHNYNITSISAPAGVSGVNGVPVGCNWIAATVTGKQTYDYVNVHARGTGAAYPAAAGNWNPAAMITAYNNTVTECTNDSLPNCPATIFNDEYGYNGSTEGGGNTDGFSAYIAQTSLFCVSLNFAACYIYQWDTAGIGLSGTPQGTAWDTVAGWTIGATVTSPLTLVGNNYEMGLLKNGITELAVWDTTKYSQPCCLAPANQTFGSAYTNYTDLTGTSTATGTGGVAPVGWKPILLVQGAVPPNNFYPRAYTGTDIVIPSSTPPNLGGLTNNGATVLDTSYLSHGQPSANLSPITRCTDQNFTPSGGLAGFSAGQGGAGSAIMWNTNSTLIHIVTTGGGSAISPFNPTTMACAGAITQDKNLTHPGSPSTAQSFGGGQFSLSNPNTWWAFGTVGSDITVRTQVTPFTFTNLTTGTFTEGVAAADFQYGLPIGSNAPEWQATHAYSLGAYVSHTMVPGEFFTYQSNFGGFHLGDIIWPTYPTGCAFVLKTLGTTGGTPPNWSSAANCGSNATSIPDGTAAWRSLVGPGKFVFQLTSAGGTSGGSTPAFVPVSTKHPDVLSTVSDGTLTWTNVGVNVTVPIWGSLTTVSADETKFVKSWSTNTYGADSSSPAGTVCPYSTCSGDQGSGQMSVTYDATANVYNLFNTLTDIQTRITCSGGTGFNCSGGSLVLTGLGKATSVPCPFYLHDSDAFATALFVSLSVQTSYLGGGCPASASATLWNPYQTFNAATQAIPFRAPINHQAFGFTHVTALGQNALNYGFQTGAYALVYPTSDVTSVPPIAWQATPCHTTSPSVWFPGDPVQPCGLEMDEHLGWAYNPGDDSTPACGTFYNNSLSNANGPIPVAAYQGEVACYSINPTWNSTSTPSALQKQWRFTHTFATQSNTNFNIWFQIGQMSQDGRFYAFGTDWATQFGSTTGTTPVLPIPNSSVSCLGGYLWQKSFAYTLGTVINPVPSLNGGGSPYHVYQAVIVTGPSGATAPSWASTVLGGRITDGGVTWQDLGTGNCRGDVVVVGLNPGTVASSTLTVTVSGLGTVMSSLPGISCPTDCSQTYASGTTVILSETPASGYSFLGWGGACTGTGNCVVTMGLTPVAVTASFGLTPQTLTVAVSGSGAVTSSPSGISCPGICSANFASGTVVTLSETPSAGSIFSGWSGACSGTGSCGITLTGPASVTATFALPLLTVSVTPSSSGTITSSPAGISCSTTCSAHFALGTTVTLTEVPGGGNAFVGWGGQCSGSGACSFTVNSASPSVTATFDTIASAAVTVTLAGTGSVISSPAGVSCPSTCSHSYTSGTGVTLSQTPGAGFVFSGWTGACSGIGACVVTTGSSPIAVTATFAPNTGTLSVTVSPSGSGTITSAPVGINCPGTCSFAFTSGTVVTLTAVPTAGHAFVGWTGGCTGFTCNITMGTSAVNATATFVPTPPSALSVIIARGVISTPGVQLVNH